METISKSQARKIVLLSQRIPPLKANGKAIDATLAAIEHLGYIQIDTISVIQRAHHHTLWNRNLRYKNVHLEQLIEDKKVFEYWSHAAAYLPMCDFRFSLPRKQAIKDGKAKHWYDGNRKLMKKVMERITAEGPLMAKDFEHLGKKLEVWESKPAKRALEVLFMRGDLMISRRQNFHKVYDLTERVLPEDTDRNVPNNIALARHLIHSYLRSHGIGQVTEFVYLLKNIKSIVSDVIQEMMSNNELLQLKMDGQLYYALPSIFDLLGSRLRRNKVSILSPFDNLIIQRKRIKTIFDFDYVLECYLPKGKRRYGYFVLPLLWNAIFAGRIDCKADRATGILHIFQLFIEIKNSEIEAFARALHLELSRFMAFNNCHSMKLQDVSPAKYKPLILLYVDLASI